MSSYFMLHDAIVASANYVNTELRALIEESIALEAKFTKEGRLNAACQERLWRINKIAENNYIKRFV